MKLSEALAAEAPQMVGPVCSVQGTLDAMNPEDSEELAGALANGVPAATLARALKRVGVHLSANTIQRHRRGDCRCPR